MKINYGTKTQVDVVNNKIYYDGKEIDNEYGIEISNAYTRLNTASYLMDSFEFTDEVKAFRIADKVRTLMDDHNLSEDAAIGQVLDDIDYYASL